MLPKKATFKNCFPKEWPQIKPHPEELVSAVLLHGGPKKEQIFS